MAYKRRSLFLASLALAIRRFTRRRKQDQKPKRRFWVRKIFSEERKEGSEWENLGEDDREYYYKYLRIIASVQSVSNIHLTLLHH